MPASGQSVDASLESASEGTGTARTTSHAEWLLLNHRNQNYLR